MNSNDTSQHMFFLDLADREEDLWSPSSPQLQEVPYQTIRLGSPAKPAEEVASSSHSTTNSSEDHSFMSDTEPAPSSPQPRQTTAHEWHIAADENKDGVHYTRERFPSEAISYLAPPFAREPVQVEENDRVLILDEVSEFALRVRVLRTGAVGVIPAWNVEGALERLARLNMIFNEVVRTP